jgi:uncharacterized membrane protein YeaQ/YmgE (transglycosylase-associated protein family)
MSIIAAVVAGVIIGVLARLIMPGKQKIGVLMTVLLGIAGGLIGSWLTSYFTHEKMSHFGFLPFVIGIVAAIILIAIYMGVTGRGSRTRPRA